MAFHGSSHTDSSGCRARSGGRAAPPAYRPLRQQACACRRSGPPAPVSNRRARRTASELKADPSVCPVHSVNVGQFTQPGRLLDPTWSTSASARLATHSASGQGTSSRSRPRLASASFPLPLAFEPWRLFRAAAGELRSMNAVIRSLSGFERKRRGPVRGCPLRPAPACRVQRGVELRVRSIAVIRSLQASSSRSELVAKPGDLGVGSWNL